MTFETLDVAALPAVPRFDTICAFDTIHDQADPSGVLGRAHAALDPGGTFLMMDVKAASDLEDMGRSPFIDTATSEGRARWAGERARDATSGDDVVTGRPAWVEPTDSTRSAARVAKAINSANGYDVSDNNNDTEGME